MSRFAVLIPALLRTACCAAALAGPLGPAVQDAAAAAPAAWRDTLYSYRADEALPLAQVLARFTSTVGLELKFADPALGRRMVRLGGKSGSPADFLDRLSDAQGLDWFVYQGVLHVSSRSSAVSERISLGPQSPADAKDALIGIGLFEARFGWGEFDTDPPTALVSGPADYVALVRRMLAVPDDASTRRERPRLMVFRLRHASATDREMRMRERSVTLPGLVSTLNQILLNSATVNPARRYAGGRDGEGGAATTGNGDPWADLAREAPSGDDLPLGGALAGLAAAHLPTPSPRSPAAARRDTAGVAAAGAATAASAFAPPALSPRRAARSGDGREDSGFTPSIAAYAPLNAVLVWDLPSRREDYRALIDELDQPSRLVEINVTILDVSANALRDWSVDIEGGTGAARVALSASGGIGAAPGTGVSGSTMALWASDRLAVRLRALESRGQAQVLSRPSVLTMNNVGALLDMNQSAYVKLVGERTTDLRTITAGTLLKVTPSIVGEGAADSLGIRVTLDIEDGQLSSSSSSSETPGVNNSAVSTEALVRPGESLVVGGYRRQGRQVTNKRVPGLSSVPLIGALFRGDSAINDERERLFILTARALP